MTRATKPLLVIVDVQSGFTDQASTKHIAKKISDYVLGRKDMFCAIIATRFINPEGSQFENLMGWTKMRNPEETQLHPLISPLVDHVLTKTGYSNAGDILEIAQQYGSKEIWLCGADTEICVLQTASGIWDQWGQTAVVPRVLYDLCASTGGLEAHKNSCDTLRRTIGERQVLLDATSTYNK